MDDFAFKQDAPGYRPSVNSSWVTGDELHVFTRQPVARFEVVGFTLRSTYRGCVCVTKSGGRLDQRIEHRVQIERRAADQLERVGRDGLPLKRLAKLVKQACIFDGDHSLRGKIFHQIYLLIIEGSDLLAIDSDSTNQVILLEHRHDQKGPSSGNLGNRLIGIFRSDVGDVCDLPRISDMVEDTGRATRRNRIALAISGPRLRCIVQRNVPEYIAFVEQQVAEASLADANSVLKHSLEHWLQLPGRRADDMQHLRGRDLLL